MESVEYTRLRDLIIKYCENTLAGEENKELIRFLSDREAKDAMQDINLEELEKISESGINEAAAADYNKVFRNILTGIERKKNAELENSIILRRGKILRMSLQIASAAAVLAIVFLLAKNIVLNPAGKIISANEKSTNEISTPFGAISRIRLIDGSEIILNAGSIMKYNIAYNMTHRDIYLEGEAYFKVNSTSNLPFKVMAGNITIMAKGTEFNVKAYSDEKIIETTLVKGLVEISSTEKEDGRNKMMLNMAPNQKAVFVKDHDIKTLEKIREQNPNGKKNVLSSGNEFFITEGTDIEEITAWTKNELIIKSEELESLVIKLQRKYDVNFVFGDDKVKSYRFTGFLKNVPLEQVLNAISLSAPINFKVDGKTITLVSK